MASARISPRRSISVGRFFLRQTAGTFISNQIPFTMAISRSSVAHTAYWLNSFSIKYRPQMPGLLTLRYLFGCRCSFRSVLIKLLSSYLNKDQATSAIHLGPSRVTKGQTASPDLHCSQETLQSRSITKIHALPDSRQAPKQLHLFLSVLPGFILLGILLNHLH